MSIFDDLARAVGELGQAQAQRRAQRLAGWGQLAHELGATFNGSTTTGIDFELEGIAGHLRTHTSSSRNANGSSSQSLSTRFRAAFALGVGPRFTVTRDTGGSIAEGLRGLFGVVDTELGGHEAFDRAFVVQTQQPQWAGQCWTHHAKERRLWDPTGAVSSDGKNVSLRLSGHLHEIERLRNGVALVVELARVNAGWIESLRELAGPGARIVPASGRWEHRQPASIEVSPGSSVRVLPAAAGPGVGVMAVCPPGRHLPFFDTRFADGRTERALREDVIVGRAVDTLRSLGRGRLYYRGERVEVSIAHPLEPQRLRAACDLAEQIALGDRSPPPQSAYR